MRHLSIYLFICSGYQHMTQTASGRKRGSEDKTLTGEGQEYNEQYLHNGDLWFNLKNKDESAI